MSYVYVVSTHDSLHYRFTPGPYHEARPEWRRRLGLSPLLLLRRGNRRFARYRSSGEPAQLEKAIKDLSAAVWGSARIAGDVDRDRRRWGTYANNLGVALLEAYQRWEGVKELDGAIACLQLAAESLPTDSPARARALDNLITAVETRRATGPEGATLPDLTTLWRELSTMASAPTGRRLAAARSWGYAAAAAEGPAAGAAGLAAAVELLPQAAWWGHSRESREALLARCGGLATDAAACAVAAEDPTRALELLEGGRAVLWRQLLTTRTDRTALRAVAPRLARRMDRVAAALERDGGMPADRRMALARRWSRLDRRSKVRLQREWDRLARRAQRAVPEGAFTMPAFGPDLRPAGAEGPVVAVVVSRLGCGALVVRDGDERPSSVELPSLTHDDVRTRARRYLGAFDDEVGTEREETVATTLGWLWETVAAPVLDALGHGAAPDTGVRGAPGYAHWPRVWWCPTGPLVTLPLHGAARLPRPDEERGEERGEAEGGAEGAATGAAVLDRVVSSYTPGMLVLIRTRRRRDAGQGAPRAEEARLLHVALGEQRDHGPLPGAARTGAYLAGLLPAGRSLTSLEGDGAVRQSVEAELGRHAWAHFDCHGVQDLDQPFRSGLVLRDQVLTVADLSGMRHDRAEFAFLAACSTSVGGSRVPDEVITVTAALQYAGYQNVIGTLSPVPDRFATRITRGVYGVLARDAGLRPSDSARALHGAVREERARYAGHPSAWVPFLHVGL